MVIELWICGMVCLADALTAQCEMILNHGLGWSWNRNMMKVMLDTTSDNRLYIMVKAVRTRAISVFGINGFGELGELCIMSHAVFARSYLYSWDGLIPRDTNRSHHRLFVHEKNT